MAKKDLRTEKRLAASNGVKSMALDDGSVYFEGWANKATIDRGQDLIRREEWNLKNFKKNAIILFNHDHSFPVGKAVEIEARDEGLYVKARIAASSDPAVSRIRDLVKEGVLNSLSVGIYVNEVDRESDINILKGVELHEISIVSVPMNQDSQFSLSAKSMATSAFGAHVALAKDLGHEDIMAALQKIEDQAKGAKSVEEIADVLASESGIEKSAALEFLKMDEGETPADIKAWMEGDQVKSSIDDFKVQALKVPKAMAATAEELSAKFEGTEYDMTNIEETEDSWLIVQIPADQFDGELRSIGGADGVVALVGVLKDSGSSETPDEEPKPDAEVPPEEKAAESTDAKGLLDEVPIAPTGPLPEGIPDSQFENPMFDQAKQTNVLLSNIVSLLQELLKNQQTEVEEPIEPVDETIIEETMPKSVDETDVKSVDSLKQNFSELHDEWKKEIQQAIAGLEANLKK